MATDKVWIESMRGVSAERRILYREIKDNLSLMFTTGIKQSVGLLEAVAAALEPGSVVQAGTEYKWRLARIPHYVEWEILNHHGELNGTVFQSVLEWREHKLDENLKLISGRLAGRKMQEHKSIADFVVTATRPVGGVPGLTQPAARALAIDTAASRKRKTADKVIELLRSRGFDKSTIAQVPVPFAQLLAESFNNDHVSTGYLSLTWREYEADPEIEKPVQSNITAPSQASQKRKKRRNRKKKAQVVPSTDAAASTSQQEDDQDEETEEANESFNIPPSITERSSVSSSSKTSNFMATEDPLLPAQGGQHTPSLLDGLTSPAEVSFVPEIFNKDIRDSNHVSEIPIKQEATGEQSAQEYGDFQSAENVHKKPQSTQTSENNDESNIAGSKAQGLSNSPRDTYRPALFTKSSSSDHIEEEISAQNLTTAFSLLQSHLSSSVDLISSAAGETLSHRAHARPHSLPSITITLASDMASPANEREQTDTEQATTGIQASAIDQEASEVDTKESKPDNDNPISNEASPAAQSSLRAIAPTFVPMFQAPEQSSASTSAIASPEFGALSSVPMSVSTSNTTDEMTAIALTQEKKSVVALDLDGLPTPIKETPMPNLAGLQIDDAEVKPWHKPEARSTAWVPSPTRNSLDNQTVQRMPPQSEQNEQHNSDDENSELEDTILSKWPRFEDNDLPLNRAWRYRELGESPEWIIQNFGMMENHYRPTPYHTTWRPLVSEAHGISMDVPAVLMETKSGCNIPLAQFDRENNVWHIYPPSQYFGPDLRDDPEHPDYLAEDKLKQVQALEVWNYRVYRSSRLAHKCLKEDCPNKVRDDDPSSMICLGCGPLSTVRWCSKYCMFEDIENHWEQCGTADFYPPPDIMLDQDISFPALFNDYMPLIQDINDFNRMERQRIHLTTLLYGGGYGLFPYDSMQCLKIELEGIGAPDLPDRVSRLLNCALLDRTLRPIISYLYLLLRDYLDAQLETPYGQYHVVLRFQIRNEWDFDWSLPDGFALLDNIKACECLWVGTENSPECKDGCPAGARLAEEYRQCGLKPLVEALERKHWILRVWRLKHPNVSDMRERLFGKGFAGVKPKKFKTLVPVLGVGWDGHISKGLKVGEWRKKLTTVAVPPRTFVNAAGARMQKKETFIWKEPEA